VFSSDYTRCLAIRWCTICGTACGARSADRGPATILICSSRPQANQPRHRQRSSYPGPATPRVEPASHCHLTPSAVCASISSPCFLPATARGSGSNPTPSARSVIFPLYYNNLVSRRQFTHAPTHNHKPPPAFARPAIRRQAMRASTHRACRPLFCSVPCDYPSAELRATRRLAGLGTYLFDGLGRQAFDQSPPGEGSAVDRERRPRTYRKFAGFKMLRAAIGVSSPP